MDVKGYSVDVKGYDVDGKGYCVDVKGYNVNVKGYGVDVKGYSVDVKGYGADVKPLGSKPTGAPRNPPGTCRVCRWLTFWRRKYLSDTSSCCANRRMSPRLSPWKLLFFMKSYRFKLSSSNEMHKWFRK